MGHFSALSHGLIIPSFYDALGQRRTRGVKLKSQGSFADLKLEDRLWTRKWQCECSQGQEEETPASKAGHSSASVTTRRPLLSPAKTWYVEANLRHIDEPVWVMAASTQEELQAAATLRAQLFYAYPQADITLGGLDAVKARVANDFLVNDLLKTRVKSELNRESKFEALGMQVKCLLAVCQQSTFESLSFPGVARPSHLPPPTIAAVDTNGTEPLVAIGTLDIQDGTGIKATADVNLVTFQLYALAHQAQHLKKQVLKGKKGKKEYFPVEQENTLEQAYIFNVCVIKEARRMGVAKALMVAALEVAKQMELRILFVHVEADNVGALALYHSLGYVVEEEEAVEVESLLRRPRRMLLSFWVV